MAEVIQEEVFTPIASEDVPAVVDSVLQTHPELSEQSANQVSDVIQKNVEEAILNGIPLNENDVSLLTEGAVQAIQSPSQETSLFQRIPSIFLLIGLALMLLIGRRQRIFI